MKFLADVAFPILCAIVFFYCMNKALNLMANLSVETKDGKTKSGTKSSNEKPQKD